jgi:hypothetical protein
MKKLLITTLTVFALFTISGCETMKLSPEGIAIRTITPVVAQNCEHVGIASTFKPVLVGGMSAAQVDIRNQIAGLGANAMVITAQYTDPPPYPHGHITAEAYRCRFPDENRSVWTAQTGRIGLELSDLTGLQRTNLERNAGAFVVSVMRESPAWDANVIPEDVLIEVNGTPVKNAAQGNSLLDEAKTAGSEIELAVIRKNSLRKIVIHGK